MPQPFRKLSQPKVDKKGADKNLKIANVDKLTTSSTVDDDQQKSTAMGNLSISTTSHTADNEAEEEAVELPPPMKPIQDSQAIINNGPAVPSTSNNEQSSCKRVSVNCC